jgi:two-component system chemotaxis sensor kinase CheA
MTPLLENFISESREILETSTRTFLDLENSPNSAEIINELFRLIHTVKGASGIIENIGPFTQLAHAMEDLMQKARDGHIVLGSQEIDVLLECCDQLMLWIDALEQSETLGDDAESISQQFKQQVIALKPGEDGASAAPEAADTNDANPLSISLPELSKKLGQDNVDALERLAEHIGCTVIHYVPYEQCFFSGDDPLAWMRSVSDRVWQCVVLVQATDPFDPYQSQAHYFVASTAERALIAEALLPIESQITLYTLAGENATEFDHRVEYVQHIVNSQITLLKSEQESEEVRTGTLTSVASVYASLSDQITDRPKTLPENACIEQTIEHFEAILTAFDEHRAVIDEAPKVDEPAPETAASVAETTDKARKKQIKTLKVDQEKVDLLMDLVGELIVAKNSMQYLAYRAENEFGIRKLAQDIKAEQTVISRLAEDLQSVVMQVRMVPLSMVFQRYPRLIRDISRRLNKQVDLIIEGEDTEADKNIVEDLSEPLVHLIRNALDHGIESPEDRQAAGKKSTGKITLSARSLDDCVVITLSDDGRGVNVAKVKARALEKGVIDEAKAERMDRQDILNLIFEPGFSTAEQVSDLSGRGVGMDSVRTTIERNGGTLLLDSEEGQGSRIQMTLPLSMTISRVMMFELSGQAFAIPVETVIETLKINTKKDLRRVKQMDTFILRGETIPVLYLNDVLGMPGQERSEIQPILVVKIGEELLGLAVDRLQEGQDVIIKPLEGALATFPIYRGAAIMGDGRVLLILNIEEVIRHAH